MFYSICTYRPADLIALVFYVIPGANPETESPRLQVSSANGGVPTLRNIP